MHFPQELETEIYSNDAGGITICQVDDTGGACIVCFHDKQRIRAVAMALLAYAAEEGEAEQ